ncbi:MAG: hypothetical protein INR65_12020 [Gluconacetobacter diazotrophicus]|nr:hypothetical protein [Gluconacetobacter diazotrophicus]
MEESRRLCERADQLIAETRQKLAHFEWFIDSLRRACEPDFFRPLQDAIRAMHGCESRHAASFAVRKVRAEQIVWTGMVEEFALLDHPAAAACYAWCYGEGSRARTFTLLRLPPIDSPQQAVQFFLLAKEQPARGAVMG